MKKLAAGVLLAALVMTAGTAHVSAVEVTHGRYYVDADKDGICDYCGEEDGCNLEICNAKKKHHKKTKSANCHSGHKASHKNYHRSKCKR